MWMSSLCSTIDSLERNLQENQGMKRIVGTFLCFLASCCLALPGLHAQNGKSGTVFGDRVQLDKTVHDFGDILLSDGPVTAVFTANNIGKEALVIYNVVSSCGCTDVEWTRQPLRTGEKGTIKVVFSNDQGPYPFDKTLTVYFSGIKQPLILRLRGESHEKSVSLSEAFPVKFGPLGVKDVEIKGGNLSQGEQKSGELTIANLGKKPLKVDFKDVTPGLSLSVSPNPVPPQEKALLSFTVLSDRKLWGKNWYYATPVLNGKSFKAVVDVRQKAAPQAGAQAMRADRNQNLGAGHDQIGFFAVTRENFMDWTKEQRENGARPMLDASTVNFPKTRAGSPVSAAFRIRNLGKSELVIYKVDSDCNALKTVSSPKIASGAEGDLAVRLDTSGLPAGETLVQLTLYTNSPLRPIVNLFLSGWIE